jgi:DNA polymerase-3 subunit epsilon
MPADRPARAAHLPAGPRATRVPGFAVIDVETTGLSAAGHRVLELAIVRTDPAGRVLDEWVSRFNPEGPVGATHIHGITAADVARAPRFAHVLEEISDRLAGAAIAGHNVRFDLAFLRAEYTRAGWALPHLPAACTLAASWDHLPHLTRRRLPDCCEAAGIAHTGAHSALGDARATAALLAGYLGHGYAQRPTAKLLALPQLAWQVTWPTTPGGVEPLGSGALAPVQRWSAIPTPPAVPLVQLLERFRLADALDDGAPDGSLPYLQLLSEVLEDGVLDDQERAALGDLAAIYDLDAEAVAAAHRGFLLALAHLALNDGRVSRAEKAELTATAGLLDVPVSEVTAVLDAAERARHTRLSAGLRPLPADWSHGEPLRVGDKVAFTGCDWAVRDRLEQRADQLGVRVMSNVSSRTALLVTDGSFDGGKADNAATLGTRLVHPDEFALLLDHLQPAVSKSTIATPSPRRSVDSVAAGAPFTPAVAEGRTVPAAHVSPSPAAVRAWARANGYEVGERGRLPAEVTEAYRHAEQAASSH